jgi:hypothetical protein
MKFSKFPSLGFTPLEVARALCTFFENYKFDGYHGALVLNQSEWSSSPQIYTRTNGSEPNKGQSYCYKNLYGF